MESLESQLITAVRDGDVKNVKALLNKGVNVNVVSSSGRTPLGMAAQTGSLPMIELLLSVNESGDNVRDDLEGLRRRERKLNNLSDKKSNRNENGGHRNESDGDDNKRNLGYFVMVHNEETGVSMTSEIEDENGSIMDENENESLCMDDAQTPDGMEDLEWDIEVKDVGNETEDDEDLWACQYRWYAQILDKTRCIVVDTPRKCDINLQDVQGRSAVHYAAKQGHLDALQLLTSAGCQVDLGDADNQTPLHLAAARDHVNVAELLISHGARVNLKTIDKMSPLHYAAARGFKDMALLLLNADAHINSLDSSDRTPLFYAVSRNRMEVAEILLKYGAKVNIEEIHGYTPICEAVWCKNVEMVRMLLEAGAKLTQSHHLLHYAVLHRHYEMAELLLSAGSVVNLGDDNGDTPLIVAARTEQHYMAELLIQKGAKVNTGNIITGSTPLHEAIQNISDSNYLRLERFVRVLQKYSVNLDKESWSARDTALTRALNLERYKAAALLIRIGANVNKFGDTGVFVFDNLIIARSKGHFPLVQMIVYAGYNLRNKSLPPAHSHVKIIDDWINYMRTNPMQLTGLCRLRIRQDVGDQISVVVNMLQIPKSLRQYLLLEDIIIDETETLSSLFI